jgi:hypothetical protein
MFRQYCFFIPTRFLFYTVHYLTKTLRGYGRLLRRRNSNSRATVIAIESGSKGWELIEYKELLLSATEYLGIDSVLKVEIKDNDQYVNEIIAQIANQPVTHYFFDPRTCVQKPVKGTWDVLRLSMYLARRGITPIARLTDVPNRFWRTLCCLITASTGICITLMCPMDIKHLFPHRRLFGPVMMPFSRHTFDQLASLEVGETSSSSSAINFVGSLYEPRTTFLLSLQSSLANEGIDLSVKGRVLGEERTSDEDYWSAIKSSPLFLTTADQVVGRGLDPCDRPHFIYRYTEALVCGVPLLATYAPGSWKYFRPNTDYLPFSSLAEAHLKIKTVLSNEELAQAIARSGSERAHSLISDSTFWRTIDLILGEDGFSKPQDLVNRSG